MPSSNSFEHFRFQETIWFPGVIGAIDCSLINIKAPTDHEEAYVNYNEKHSLNVLTSIVKYSLSMYAYYPEF